jgi:hypothetical protein
MSTIRIKEADRKVLEDILIKVAEQHAIDDVNSIKIELTKDAGVVQFEREKEALFPLAALIALISTFAYKMAADPDIQKLVDDIVQGEVEAGKIAGNDKPKYVEMVTNIITDGASQVVEEFKAQEQQKQTAEQAGQMAGQPAPAAQVASVEDERIKVAVKSTLENIMNWGSEVGENILNSVKDFFSGPSRQELTQRVVEMSVRKGFIPGQYATQFQDYLNNFIERGFQQADTAVAQQKEKEQKGEVAKPAEQPGQQPAKPAQPKTAPAEKELGKMAPGFESKGPGQSATDQTMAWAAGNEYAIQQFMQQQGMSRDQAINELMRQERANQPKQNPAEIAGQAQEAAQTGAEYLQKQSNTSERTKQAWIAQLIKYGPMVAEVVTTILEYLKHKEGEEPEKMAEEGMSKKDEIVNSLERVVDKIQDVINGRGADLAIVIANALGIDKSNSEELRGVLNSALQGIYNFLDSVRGGKEDISEDSPQVMKDVPRLTASEIDNIIKEGYVQLNSGTFLIKKGNDYYSELENLLMKVAQDNKISNVKEINVKLSVNDNVVSFKKVALKLSPMNALMSFGASALTDKLMGKEFSLGRSLVAGGAGAFQNLGGILGRTAANVAGFGGVGQEIAGMIGSGLWSWLVQPMFEDKKEAAKRGEALESSYAESMSDPNLANVVTAIAEKKGVSEKRAWLDLARTMAKTSAEKMKIAEQMAEQQGISVEEALASIISNVE